MLLVWNGTQIWLIWSKVREHYPHEGIIFPKNSKEKFIFSSLGITLSSYWAFSTSMMVPDVVCEVTQHPHTHTYRHFCSYPALPPRRTSSRQSSTKRRARGTTSNAVRHLCSVGLPKHGLMRLLLKILWGVFVFFLWNMALEQDLNRETSRGGRDTVSRWSRNQNS